MQKHEKYFKGGCENVSNGKQSFYRLELQKWHGIFRLRKRLKIVIYVIIIYSGAVSR